MLIDTNHEETFLNYMVNLLKKLYKWLKSLFKKKPKEVVIDNSEKVITSIEIKKIKFKND